MQLAEMESSLEQQLHEEIPGAEPGSPLRLNWLSHRFSLYASRLSGFATAVSAPVGTLRESDLFRAVEVGAAVVAREVETSPAQNEIRNAWKDVIAALNALRSDFTQTRIAVLSEEADRWRSKVLAGK